MRARVLFYVQTLLGVGHLKRASLIAHAMVEAGLDVSVVLGGNTIPGIDFAGCRYIQLPPVRALDSTFSVLVDDQNRPIDDAWRDRRLSRLLHEFDAIDPDLVLIELFPFGRWAFRFELIPLVEAAAIRQPRPRLVSSVRDILVRKHSPERNRRIVEMINRYFDRVLIHGDPALIPFDDSFPEVGRIADKIVYTGYVTGGIERDSPTVSSETGQGEVIVSVGGGAVGEPLLRAAMAARGLSQAANCVWRLIAGPNLDRTVFDDLAWNKPAGVIVERWRTDLPQLFRRCLLSISQGGYNTLMDVLASGTRSVVVPFADGDESEQTQRALALAHRGVVNVIEPQMLSPELLAAAVDKALTSPVVSLPLKVEGAVTTGRLLAALANAR